jgi:hypothetical protein
MERHRPTSERARRNRATATLLMRRRHNPQDRLKIIGRRHIGLNPDNPIPSQLIIWNEKEIPKAK